MPFALSPARVHEAAYWLCGHRPCWVRLAYRGGIYSIEHYRTCSYCGCIHPGDMIELLQMGGSKLERTTKLGKHLLLTPNPIAGELVRMGSMPGRVFERERAPGDLVSKLLLAPRHDFAPSISERLAEHYDRPCYEPAPNFIKQPFYSEHSTDSQWAQIEASAEGA